MHRLFLLFILFQSFNVKGNNLIPVTLRKHFDTQDGLNTKTVYSIVQDKQGFIWFGTDAGAYRYDGNEFKHYTVDNGLTDNEILRLYLDKKGRVWFLTYNGYLSFWYNGTIYNLRNTSYLKKAYLGSSIADAVEDNEGTIWFCALRKGLIAIHDTTVWTLEFPLDKREEAFPFLSIDKNDSISYFDHDSLINIHTAEGIRLNGVALACCVDRSINNTIYFTSKGVFKIDNNKSEPYILDSLPDFTKISTMFYENDNVWICTLGNGCRLFHNKKYIKTYLPNSSVTGIMRDREGNVWMATMNDGAYVFYQNNNSIINYDKSSGLSDNKVFSIAVDHSKNIWLGFFNGSVDKIKDNKKETFKVKTWNLSDYLRVLGMIIVNDTVWCATDGGIYYIWNKNVVKISYPKRNQFINNYSVKQIIADENNNIYGSFNFNYLKVEKSDTGYYAHPVLDDLTRTFSSVKGNGKFYVSTLTGLMEYAPGKYFRPLKTQIDFSHLRIPDMKIDRNGQLILATNSDGVFILSGDSVIEHISSRDKLSDNNCRKLYLKDSLLYIGTENGLNICIKKNNKWQLFDIINKRNGLIGNSINDIVVNDDLIYIATDDGLSIVNKNNYLKPVYQTNIIITDLLVDTISTPFTNIISFRSDVKRLLIKFSYPVFNLNNRQQIKYRLKRNNREEEWSLTTNNEVEFSSLIPGTYFFEIMPDIGNLSVSGITTLRINVLPRWWQTTYARILFSVLLLSLIIYFIRMIIRFQYDRRLKQLKQQNLIDAERNRIATDMHDDIGADLTQISIWTNILKSNRSNSDSIIEKISKLSKDVLAKMDQIIWALNSIHNQSSDLFSYLHSYSSEYLEGVDINMFFHVSENVPEFALSVSQRRNIFLVVKELLHNTVKHSNASEVNVHIYLTENNLILEYQDNGEGFDLNNKSDGIGLSTMKQRMKEIKSKLEIVSLTGHGMKVKLYLNVFDKMITP